MMAVIGYILLGIALVVLLIPALPFAVRLHAEQDVWVTLSVLGVPVFRFSPSDKKDKPKTKSAHKKKKKRSDERPKPTTVFWQRIREDGVSAAVSAVKELARMSVTTLRRVLASVTVTRLKLKIYVSSEDASATAQTVGRLCAVLYPSLATVQSVMKIRHREVTVTPDFLADKGRLIADVNVRVIPYRLFWAVVRVWPAFNSWRKRYFVIQSKEEQKDGKQ